LESASVHVNNNNNNNNNVMESRGTQIEITANRPDVIIKNEKRRGPAVEIQRLWNLKCKIIPTVIGATEIATNG
jgi:hypothetical protein